MASLRYPKGLDGSTSDYVVFEFYNYEPAFSGGPKNTAESYSYSVTQLKPSKIASTAGAGSGIAITMPNDIGSSVKGEWGQKSMNGLVRAGIGAIGGAINESGNFFNSETSLASKFNALKLGTGDLLTGALGGFAEDAIRGTVDALNKVPGLGSSLSASDIVGGLTGFIINPNTELLYQGTGLRTHGYRFKLIAQSTEEADDILSMVNIFKQIAAPKGAAQRLGSLVNRNFIGIPDVVQVKFYNAKAKGESEYLPRYKLSALTSVNVDYITEGQYMTFTDGKPIGVNLSLEFTELKLIFSEEYGTGSNQYR